MRAVGAAALLHGAVHLDVVHGERLGVKTLDLSCVKGEDAREDGREERVSRSRLAYFFCGERVFFECPSQSRKTENALKTLAWWVAIPTANAARRRRDARTRAAVASFGRAGSRGSSPRDRPRGARRGRSPARFDRPRASRKNPASLP